MTWMALINDWLIDWITYSYINRSKVKETSLKKDWQIEKEEEIFI